MLNEIDFLCGIGHRWKNIAGGSQGKNGDTGEWLPAGAADAVGVQKEDAGSVVAKVDLTDLKEQ